MDQRLEIYKAWKKSDSEISNYALKDSLQYLTFISPYLQIRDLFTGEEVDNVVEKKNDSEKNKFALYTINHLFKTPYWILIFYKGEFKVISFKNYPQTIRSILGFFNKHQELDKRLLPLCVQEVTKIYVNNVKYNEEYGPWRKWWGESADSLGKIYNKYLLY